MRRCASAISAIPRWWRVRSAACGGSWWRRRIIWRGAPKQAEDIAEHDTIQFGAVAAAPEWRFARDGKKFRVAHLPRFTTNIADAAIWHAEQGGGLAAVLAYQAAAGIAAGRLKPVLTKFERPPLPIHIVYPTSRLLSAKVRAFIDLAVETCTWNFGRR